MKLIGYVTGDEEVKIYSDKNKYFVKVEFMSIVGLELVFMLYMILIVVFVVVFMEKEERKLRKLKRLKNEK